MIITNTSHTGLIQTGMEEEESKDEDRGIQCDESLNASANSINNNRMNFTLLLQIRPGLATAIESEAGAARIISEDDLGHDY